MNIIEIHGYHLAFPLPETIGNSTGFFDRRGAFVLRLVGEGGISGEANGALMPHVFGTMVNLHASLQMASGGTDLTAPLDTNGFYQDQTGVGRGTCQYRHYRGRQYQ